MIQKTFSWLLALFTPLFMIAVALASIAQPWFIDHEYTKLNLQEHNLAYLGLRSVMPGGMGTALLKNATLKNGTPAFNEREIKHMSDVRRILLGFFLLTLMGFFLLCALFLLMRNHRTYYLLKGLYYGSALTLAFILTIIAAIFLSFDSFFLYFHYLFFEGDSFLFNPDDMLIQLYPEQFWEDAALGVGLFSVGISVITLFLSTHFLKASKRFSRA